MWIDRWAGLASAMAIQGCGGLTYTFSVYSEHLKQVLDLSQERTDVIGSAKDFGYSLGIVGGLLYNLYPPFITIVIGALLHFVGYIIVWTTITQKISPPFWLLCLSIAVGVGGDSWMDAACLFTNLRSFPEQRGTVMGVLKAEIGLSGAIFVTIYEAFLKPNVDKYVLLVALGPTIISLALALFIRNYPPDSLDGKQANVKRRFQLTYGAIIALAFFLLVTIIVQAAVDHELGTPVLVGFAVIMLSIMGLTFVIPVLHRPLEILRMHLTNERPAEHSTEVTYLSTASCDEHPSNLENGTSPGMANVNDNGHTQVKSVVQETEEVEHQVLTSGDEDQQPLKGEGEMNSEAVIEEKGEVFELTELEDPDITLRMAVQGLNFWFLAFLVMTGPGCGLAVVNNLSQMGKALDADEVELYVGLFSIWSCLGRLIAGYGSDSLLRNGYPRPLCLAAAHLIMMLGCLLLATGSVQVLYLGSAFVGLAYGGFWSLVPCIVSEVFGLRQFAAIYKCVVSMAPVGAYILSAKVVGFLYDKEVIYYHKRFPGRHWNPTSMNTCYGRRCFGFSLLFLALICLLGAAVDLVFAMRTNRFYQKCRASLTTSS